MDNIDATDRSIPTSTAPPPSLLIIILDTNPLSWSHLSSTLPLPSVIRALLVFINAHLAMNHANQVAVLASHVDQVAWLYPDAGEHTKTASSQANGHLDGSNQNSNTGNKYRPFMAIEETILKSLQNLVASTPRSTESLNSPPLLSGAMSIALAYANRQVMQSNPVSGDVAAVVSGAPGAADLDSHTSALRSAVAGQQLVSRVLIISASRADLSSQYIGLMNSVFAAQRLHIPIDVLRVGDRTAFLQQASDATSGVFMSYEPSAAPTSHGTNGTNLGSTNSATAGLLQTLMMGYLPDATARQWLVMPGSVEVDFRAACFCHGKVVDLGGVCSVCLSIFCLPLEFSSCPTCQSPLRVPKSITTKPVVIAKKKKKKKKLGDHGRDSAAGTPAPGSTPTPH